MTLTVCYTVLYVFGRTGLSKQCRPRWDTTNVASHQGLHCLPLIQLFLDTTLGNKLYLFKFKIKYGKELRCLNTKGKYTNVTDTEINWLIISKSVMIIIFVEFIDQLNNCLINCAILGSQWFFMQITSLDQIVHMPGWSGPLLLTMAHKCIFFCIAQQMNWQRKRFINWPVPSTVYMTQIPLFIWSVTVSQPIK